MYIKQKYLQPNIYKLSTHLAQMTCCLLQSKLKKRCIHLHDLYCFNFNPYHNRITIHTRICHCWKNFINEGNFSEHKDLKFLLFSTNPFDWRYYRSSEPGTVEEIAKQIKQVQNYWKQRGNMRKERFQFLSCSKCGTFRITAKAIEILDLPKKPNRWKRY